jgi:hypothetical protein
MPGAEFQNVEALAKMPTLEYIAFDGPLEQSRKVFPVLRQMKHLKHIRIRIENDLTTFTHPEFLKAYP